MTPAETTPAPRVYPRVWLVAVAVVLVAGFLLRAAYYRGGYSQGDEEIAVKVVGHLRQGGDWDTNWAKADLPPSLRYDQYNFSSHLYAAYFFYRFVKLLPGTEAWRSAEAGLWVYRFFSVVLATAAVAALMSVAFRAGGRTAALAAGFLGAVSTQLVQDAHFARAEPFTTLLTLGMVICCWPREGGRPVWIAAAGFLLGLLVACKVSMVLLAWLPLVPLFSGGRPKAEWARAALAGGLAFAAGFWLGAPGAVAHPEKFLDGVRHLMNQYGSGHPPHGHPGGGRVGDLLAGFFGATLGWTLLAAAALGAARLAGARRWSELALLVGPVVVFAIYFSTQRVFFERNLSHVLPLVFVLAALGLEEFALRIGGSAVRARIAWTAALVVLVAVRPARLTAGLVLNEFSGRGGRQVAALDELVLSRHAGARFVARELLVATDLEVVAEHFRTRREPLLLRVCDYRDEWTAARITELQAGYHAKLVAENPGSFPGVPTSTLVVYHSWTDRYFLITGPR